jgi:hypothetical protein
MGSRTDQHAASIWLVAGCRNQQNQAGQFLGLVRSIQQMAKLHVHAVSNVTSMAITSSQKTPRFFRCFRLDAPFLCSGNEHCRVEHFSFRQLLKRCLAHVFLIDESVFAQVDDIKWATPHQLC